MGLPARRGGRHLTVFQRRCHPPLGEHVATQLFAEGLRRAGRELDAEKLVDALESIRDYDVGIGTVMGFGPSEHQASHKVWGTMMDAQGQFRTLEMD
jgi:branched-chain amino acid transport system substrate-binding protein